MIIKTYIEYIVNLLRSIHLIIRIKNLKYLYFITFLSMDICQIYVSCQSVSLYIIRDSNFETPTELLKWTYTLQANNYNMKTKLSSFSTNNTEVHRL